MALSGRGREASMGAVEPKLSRALGELTLLSGCVDFILVRMKEGNVSRRQVANLTGISRTRIHATLHSEVDKRASLRMDEYQVILDVLRIGQLEAAVAAELIDNEPDASFAAVTSIASMLSEALRGLPGELAEMVDMIDGLHHADVRKEHGGRVRKLIVQFLTNHYRDVAARRDFRLKDID